MVTIFITTCPNYCSSRKNESSIRFVFSRGHLCQCLFQESLPRRQLLLFQDQAHSTEPSRFVQTFPCFLKDDFLPKLESKSFLKIGFTITRINTTELHFYAQQNVFYYMTFENFGQQIISNAKENAVCINTFDMIK